jgi:hypothetical protein
LFVREKIIQVCRASRIVYFWNLRQVILQKQKGQRSALAFFIG